MSAKTWAALFAAREWALKAERGELQAPPEKPAPTWRESLASLRELEAEKKRLESWQPRSVVVGTDVPASGDSTAYATGTPERCVVEYLDLWRRKNYGHMAHHIAPKFSPSPNIAAARVREAFASKALLEFELLTITDEAPAVSVVRMRVRFKEGGAEIDKEVDFRLVNIDSEGSAEIAGKPGTDWRLVFWQI